MVGGIYKRGYCSDSIRGSVCSVNFFFDNNLPPPLARALNELSMPEGHTVQHLRALYPSGKVPDEVWIARLAEESDWSIVSIDNILRNAAAYRALKSSGLNFFFLYGGWGNLSMWTIVHKLVQRWPAILRATELIAPGQAYRVRVKSNKLEPFRI